MTDHKTLRDAIEAIESAKADLNKRLEAGSVSKGFHDVLYNKYDEVLKDLQNILDGIGNDQHKS